MKNEKGTSYMAEYHNDKNNNRIESVFATRSKNSKSITELKKNNCKSIDQ